MAGGSFCSLDVLYGGKGMHIVHFFNCMILQFFVIKSLDPGSETGIQIISVLARYGSYKNYCQIRRKSFIFFTF
jgi:hypothetical protein